MILNILKQDLSDSEDRLILQDNLLILFIIIQNDDRYFKYMLDPDKVNLQQMIIKGIYYPNTNIRKLFAHVFYLLGK